MSAKDTANPLLESIATDVRIVGSFMRELSMHVINEEISHFPVYVAYKEEINIGKPMFSMRRCWYRSFNVRRSASLIRAEALTK